MITHQSYGGKVTNSFGGVCFGIVLFFAMIVLIFWNEGQAVRDEQSLAYGKDNTVTVDCKAAKSTDSGKTYSVGTLCYANNCPVNGYINVTDSTGQYDFTATNVLSYSKSVEINQWTESTTSQSKSVKNNVGGGTTTYTSYRKSFAQSWVTQKWNSQACMCTGSQGGWGTQTSYCINCLRSSSAGQGFYCSGVVTGNCGVGMYSNECAYGLSLDLCSMSLQQFQTQVLGRNEAAEAAAIAPELITFGTGLDKKVADNAKLGIWGIPEDNVDGFAEAAASTKIVGKGGFAGQSSNPLYGRRTTGVDSPGDKRITFDSRTATSGSFWGQCNSENKVVPFAKGDITISNYFNMGSKSLQDFFKTKEDNDNARKWGIRIAGFLFLCVSMQMIAGPLSVMPDIVPFLGPVFSGIVGNIICIVSLLVGALVTLFVIGCAWVVYRPLIGVPMLLVSVLLLVGVIALCRRNRGAPGSKTNINTTGAIGLAPVAGVSTPTYAQPGYGAPPANYAQQPYGQPNYGAPPANYAPGGYGAPAGYGAPPMATPVGYGAPPMANPVYPGQYS